jgi:hypothetical protein
MIIYLTFMYLKWGQVAGLTLTILCTMVCWYRTLSLKRSNYNWLGTLIYGGAAFPVMFMFGIVPMISATGIIYTPFVAGAIDPLVASLYFGFLTLWTIAFHALYVGVGWILAAKEDD